MFTITMDARDLESGMVLRSKNGRFYTLDVDHTVDGTVVRMDGMIITYPQGHGVITSFESESDWRLPPTCDWYLFGADESGSIAEMPLAAVSREDAETMARRWMYMYDHGWSQAVVVDWDVHEGWRSETVETIHMRITERLVSQHLL